MRELSEEAKSALELNDEERIHHIHKDKWVKYPEAERILTRFNKLLLLPETTRMKSLALVSRSNNGVFQGSCRLSI